MAAASAPYVANELAKCGVLCLHGEIRSSHRVRSFSEIRVAVLGLLLTFTGASKTMFT